MTPADRAALDALTRRIEVVQNTLAKLMVWMGQSAVSPLSIGEIQILLADLEDADADE